MSAFTIVIIIIIIFKSAISVALVTQNIESEKMLNPLPVQGFAGDIAIVTYDERSLHEMIIISEPIIHRVNLDVKASKCTVLYGRRSENNWYTGKNDKKPNIVLKKKHQGIEKN